MNTSKPCNPSIIPTEYSYSSRSLGNFCDAVQGGLNLLFLDFLSHGFHPQAKVPCRYPAPAHQS